MQARQRLLMRTPRFEAGRAGQVHTQDPFALPVGSGPARLCRAKEGNDRLAEGGGNVHRARVVAQHQLTQPDPFDQFRKRSLPGQVQTPFAVDLRNGFAQRADFIGEFASFDDGALKTAVSPP